MYKWGSKKGHSFSLGLHSTLFQAEIYIKECILESMEKGYKGRHIYIFSDSHAAIKALNNFLINSALVWDCHQSLVKLAEYNRIQLICMLGHMGNDVNEISDQLDTDSSSHLLIGLEPTIGIFAKVATRLITDWMSRNMSSTGSLFTDKGRLRALLKTL